MLTELKTFIAIVRYGTFEQAGQRIGLTQGAVSAQIKRLEEELGKNLFDRVGRKSVLSEFGHQLLPRAEQLLADAQSLKFGSVDRFQIGRYRFGAIYSQSGWLMRSIALVRTQYPSTRFRLIPGSSHDLAGQVDAGEIDLAVIIRPPYQIQAELTWVSLGVERYLLLVPQDCPETDIFSILRKYPFIRYDSRSYGGRLVERFLSEHHVQVSEIIETDDILGLVSAVSSGLGVTITPAIEAIMPFPTGVKAIDLEKFALHREVGILHRSDHERSTMEELLIATCASQMTKISSQIWAQINRQPNLNRVYGFNG